MNQDAINKMLDFLNTSMIDESLSKSSRLTAELAKELYEPYVRWVGSKADEESASPGEVLIATARIQAAMVASTMMRSVDSSEEYDLETIDKVTDVFRHYARHSYSEARKKLNEKLGH